MNHIDFYTTEIVNKLNEARKLNSAGESYLDPLKEVQEMVGSMLREVVDPVPVSLELTTVEDGNAELIAPDTVMSTLTIMREQSERAKMFENEFKEELLTQMEKHEVRGIENDHLKVLYMPESESMRFSTAAFKKDHPELHAEYSKPSKRRAHIRVTYKD